jgi:hypothetical protein
LDFSTRTSDKAAYVSPTRGAQGNALKTVLAIPYVLNGGRSPTTVRFDARGLRHSITVSTDHVLRRPQIEHLKEEIVKTEGTTIHVRLDSASSQGLEPDPGFLQRLLFDYSLFNPHASFTLYQEGMEEGFLAPGSTLRSHWEATTPGWRKWLPSDPTSAHWYTPEQLENLIAAYVSAERHGARARTVREFVSEFRGLSSTMKQKQVVTGAGLDRAYLHDLVGGTIDRGRLETLLEIMQRETAPVKPEALGVLGEEHFRSRLQVAEGDHFRYRCLKGTDQIGMPYVVECAFALSDDPLLRGEHIGLNWSVPLSNPILDDVFEVGGHEVEGLPALLEACKINLDYDTVSLALHIISPRFHFLDRGKGRVSLTFAEAVGKAVLDVTKEWSKYKKKLDRDQDQADRIKERLLRGRSSRITVKDAAYAAIPDAYDKASGGGRYPANARQVMYAARPAIQEMTGPGLSDEYFTQTLLPNFIRDHPEETAKWDVVYDARGHLFEPHTDREVGLGTLGVRDYLASMKDDGSRYQEFELPELTTRFHTSGPRARYGAVLYIEKEGFLPLLQQARFAERYDLAIMSSKGMGTTAVRTLIEKLCRDVKVLVLHDFDKSGFSILGTLKRDTRRYTFATVPEILDLGLRLVDVQAWELQTEDVTQPDPSENLELNGATPEEVEFLRGEYDDASGKYKGKRVELNMFTSEMFVQWLDAKLTEHKIEKVIPDDITLELAYRRAARIRRIRDIMEATREEVEVYAQTIEPPQDLRSKLKEQLDQDPSIPWDDALELL